MGTFLQEFEERDGNIVLIDMRKVLGAREFSEGYSQLLLSTAEGISFFTILGELEEIGDLLDSWE